MTDAIIVDAYEGDGRKDWTALAAAGDPWRGAIVKISQGNWYNGGTWLPGAWRMIELAGVHAARPPEQWIRGGYHYYDTRIDPIVQCEYMLATIKRAGGLKGSDVMMVDVERSGQRAGVSAAQVVDGVSAFVEHIKQLTGHWTMLYGGSWLRDLDITDRMGCKYLAIARYTPTLPPITYQRIGWDRANLALWQYAAAEDKGLMVDRLAGYPGAAPGCGPIDCSAVVLPGGTAALLAP